MDIEKSGLLSERVHLRSRPASSTFSGRRPRLILCLATAAIVLLAFNLFTKLAHMSSKPVFSSSSQSETSLGIVLTPTYGTVAVRDGSGELDTVLSVPGDNSYISMMKRLSDPASRHPSEPYRGIGEIIADWPRQALRHGRKRIGLPSSSDVGTVAAMIKDLKSALLKAGHDVEKAGAILAFPAITALYEEDARDALEYLAIPNLIGTHIISHVPYALDAAFSGYGYGMCDSWQDRQECRRETDVMPRKRTLMVDYSRKALSVDFTLMSTVTGNYVPPIGAEVDFDLGSNSKVPGADESHWSLIRDKIASMVESKVWKTVDLVLLIGDSAGDPDFLTAVTEAVSRYNPEVRLDNDPEFVAAKGISEMAYRAQKVMDDGGTRLIPRPEAAA